MSVDINSLYKRLTAIEQEVSYAERKRREEAEKAVAALSELQPEDIERIKEYIPDIVLLRSCTADDLIANKNGELQKLQLAYSKLSELLDSWLKVYEEGLC